MWVAPERVPAPFLEVSSADTSLPPLAAGLTTIAVAVSAVASAAGYGPSVHTADAREQIVGGKARNVILLIGDGMGDSEITLARN